MISEKVGLVADAGRIAGSILWERLGPTIRLHSPASVPPSAESITTDWLTKVLCANVTGARGHWALDYSYALAGALETSDRREWQEDLLKLYLRQLGEAGVSSVPTFDDAWLAYRQQCLHGVVFGLFTLGGSRFEPELQPRDYTLAAIARITRHATDLDAIDAVLSR